MPGENKNTSSAATVTDFNDIGVPSATNRLADGLSINEFMANKQAFFEMAGDEEVGMANVDLEEEENEMKSRIIDSQIKWSEMIAEGNFDPNVSTANEHLESYDTIASRMVDVLYDVDGSPLIPGGVKKRMIRRGIGDNAKQGDLVWIHYKLFVEQGDEPFDDTMAQGSPKRFTIGHGEVIKGLDISVVGMNKGQIDHALVSYQYAFGFLGCGDRVPKESTVLMYIHLLSIRVTGSELSVEDLRPEERREKGFDAVYAAVERRKAVGNDLLKQKEESDAIKEYLKAQDLANELMPLSPEETGKRDMVIYQIQLNLAKAYIDADKYRKAIKHCQEALAGPLPDSKKTKAYYRLAKAYYESGKAEEALKPIKLALALCTGDNDIKKLFEEITNEVSKRKNQERETAKKMFQQMKLD